MASSSRKTVALATIALHQTAGGLEKNIVNLANALSQRGYDVHLITFDRPGAISFYPLEAAVRWHMAGNTTPHSRISFPERLNLICRVRRILKSFDPKTPLICFNHGILTRFFLANLFLNLPLICSERSSLSLYKHMCRRRWNLNFLLMGFCKKITVQFPGYIKNYPKPWQSKIVSIGNPVIPASLHATPARPDDRGRWSILCIGRIDYPKNIDVLIRAFSLLAARYPDWDLHIIGDGGQKNAAAQIIAASALENRVFLHGKRSDVPSYFARSHIFCMPSLWEGFPNALAEAMAHGLPVVGFEACDGVRDLIRHEQNGLLARGKDDPQELAAMLETLMHDPHRRTEMGHQARLFMEAYDPQKIYDLWEELIRDIGS